MGKKPKLLLDIHSVSDINPAEVDLAALPGPATNETFNGNPNAYGINVTDVKIGEGENKEGTDTTNPSTP